LKIVSGGTIFKNKIFCRDQKQQQKFTGTKTKTRHICRDQNHILAFILSNTLSAHVRKSLT